MRDSKCKTSVKFEKLLESNMSKDAYRRNFLSSLNPKPIKMNTITLARCFNHNQTSQNKQRMNFIRKSETCENNLVFSPRVDFFNVKPSQICLEDDKYKNSHSFKPRKTLYTNLLQQKKIVV